MTLCRVVQRLDCSFTMKERHDAKDMDMFELIEGLEGHLFGAAAVVLVGFVWGVWDRYFRVRHDTPRYNEDTIPIDCDMTGYNLPHYHEFFVEKGTKLTPELIAEVRRVCFTEMPMPKGVRPKLTGAIYNW